MTASRAVGRTGTRSVADGRAQRSGRSRLRKADRTPKATPVQRGTRAPRGTRSRGVRTFVRRAGRHRLFVHITPGRDAGRTPLLVCGGIGAPAQLMQGFIDRLDPAVEVIRIDPPGVGRSPATLTPYRLPELAWEINRILRALGYDRVDVLGISWGGALAQQFALQAPRRCRRVVLVSTGASYSPPPLSLHAVRRLTRRRAYRGKGVVGAVAGEMYGGRARTQPATAAHIAAVQLLAHRPMGTAWQFLAGLGWTSAWFLPWLHQPTLVLSGTDDRVVHPVQGRLLAALTRRSEVHLYRGGHVDLLINPRDLVGEIEAFLARR